MKHLISAVVVAITALATPLAAQDSLKYASLSPERAAIIGKGVFPFLDAIEAEANGSLTVDRFPGRQLVKSPKAIYPGLINGVFDIAYFGITGVSGEFEYVDVFGLPGLFESPEESAEVIWRMIEKGSLSYPEEIVPLAVFSNGNAGLYLRDEVSSLADVQGLKITSSGSALDLIAALGASPVRMGITEVAPSMTSKVVDGSMAGWEALRTFQIGPASKTFIDADFGVTVFLLSISRAAYDGLSDASRSAIDANRGASPSVAMASIYKGGVKRAQGAAKKAGGFISVPAEEVADAFAKVHADWLEKNGEAGKAIYDRLLAEIEAVRSGS